MFADQKPAEWTADDWRFTAKNGDIYAFCLNPVASVAPGGKLCLSTFAAYHDGIKPPFNGVVERVEQLGAGAVAFERSKNGMSIIPLPRDSSMEELPVGFKITVR